MRSTIARPATVTCVIGESALRTTALQMRGGRGKSSTRTRVRVAVLIDSPTFLPLASLVIAQRAPDRRGLNERETERAAPLFPWQLASQRSSKALYWEARQGYC